MLTRLLETKQVRSRTLGGTAVSIMLHGALVAAAVAVTRHTAEALTKPEETPVFITNRAPEPEPPAAPVGGPHAPAPAPLGHQVLTAPVTISVDIPPVNVNAPPTNAGDFTGEGVSGGRADGVRGGTAPVVSEAPLFDFEVDKPAAALPGTGVPPYPEPLKAAGVEGEVLVEFVVDTLGRAEVATFRVLEATHPAFGESVRAALGRMRFVPAEARGGKVRMLVQQRFAFALDR